MYGLQTPRRFPQARPSINNSSVNTASSPNLNAPGNGTAFARKASLNALTGDRSPSSDMAPGGSSDLAEGDRVDVPGGMHGLVKFVGNVRGKKGVFAGVELSSEFAARGKNDGDVDGVHYFQTSVPGAGIFLPIHRAVKRASDPPSNGVKSPFASSTSAASAKRNPATTGLPNFSQSVGPGARAPSPQLKPKTRGPSLARPESPLRKTPSLTPTHRGPPSVSQTQFNRSQIGAPRLPTSPSPSKPPSSKPRTPVPSRPYSRSNAGSRTSHRPSVDDDFDATPIRKRGSADTSALEKQVQDLTKELEERDSQLKEQANTLAEMEQSFAELQTLTASREAEDPEDADIAQLREVLREKNDKISMLTAEFDSHRADFRSTIDTLEMASTETVRVYEDKLNGLLGELEALQNENAALQEQGEDVESVARQLKDLEDLVQELEEGLEDARRGEAEARGEVEFLRGEVERGRSELRREREKAATALKGAGAAMDGAGSKEVAQRDDEIRGLKAIIHSLSSGGEPSPRPLKTSFEENGDSPELEALRQQIERLESDKGELRGLIERKAYREDELEREVERLKSGGVGMDHRSSVTSSGKNSESTATQERPTSSRRPSASKTPPFTHPRWSASPQASRRSHDQAKRSLDPTPESDGQSSAESNGLWCEICETGGHDILNCTAMGGGNPSSTSRSNSVEPPAHKPRSFSNHSGGPKSPPSAPAPLSPSLTKSSVTSPGAAPSKPLPNPYDSGLVPGKGHRTSDPDKWCALCERDGHDVTECPYEDAF